MVDGVGKPGFPNEWIATYHDLLPRLREMTNPNGGLYSQIRVPQGPEADQLRDTLEIFQNQFDCRTAELQSR